MSCRVFVTGIGIISAIGNNIDETLNSIYHSRSGIGHISHLDTIHKDSIPVAEVKCSETELFKLAGINQTIGYSRTALLGLIAAKEALEYAKIKDFRQYRTGLISATTVGGMDKSELYYRDIQINDTWNIYIDTHDCADSTVKIADHLGIKQYLTTVSTACSSSANAIILGTRLIKHGLLDRVIVGGTECLTKYHLNGFNSLSILDRYPCRPFDENRNGLNLGEGAGYLVIESEKAAYSQNEKEILCEVSGYGNACEAFHQTASSPEGYGAFLAMNKAFESCNIRPEDIDYINAHGTGTSNNDLSEGLAIEKIFSSKVPFVSSTKSFTGHTTSAAGAVEAILSILAMKNSLILPNLNFSDQMKELKFSPVRQLIRNKEIRHFLSNSFGFGGNVSSIIFSKYQ